MRYNTNIYIYIYNTKIQYNTSILYYTMPLYIIQGPIYYTDITQLEKNLINNTWNTSAFARINGTLGEPWGNPWGTPQHTTAKQEMRETNEHDKTQIHTHTKSEGKKEPSARPQPGYIEGL